MIKVCMYHRLIMSYIKKLRNNEIVYVRLGAFKEEET